MPSYFESNRDKFFRPTGQQIRPRDRAARLPKSIRRETTVGKRNGREFPRYFDMLQPTPVRLGMTAFWRRNRD